MNNNIYSAEKNLDMFDLEIPQFDTGTEIQSPPVPDNTSSEFDSFLNKSFISFGTLAVCIVVILLIAFIIKKKNRKIEIDVPRQEIQRQISVESSVEKSESQEYISKKRIKNRSLNTPGSIQKCIKAFLENTKNI